MYRLKVCKGSESHYFDKPNYFTGVVLSDSEGALFPSLASAQRGRAFLVFLNCIFGIKDMKVSVEKFTEE